MFRFSDMIDSIAQWNIFSASQTFPKFPWVPTTPCYTLTSTNQILQRTTTVYTKSHSNLCTDVFRRLSDVLKMVSIDAERRRRINVGIWAVLGWPRIETGGGRL